MRNFDYRRLKDNLKWDSELVNLLTRVHEYRGKQEVWLRQKPAQLENLLEIAKIQSTEASNRIEGIVTTNSRLNALMTEKTTPRNRDEEEILGYRNVLDLIHSSYEYINVNPNTILQLHRDLLAHTSESYAVHFKNSPNEIDLISNDGTRTVLFQPLSPFETPSAMEEICSQYQAESGKEAIDPLILVFIFILDFLCIHPFNDGNGRMSRLLTLLLLYQNQYFVGQYISIEKEIAKTKDSYYLALQQADQKWHEGENDPVPFIKYMLSILIACYRELDDRIQTVEQAGIHSTAYEIVKNYSSRTLGPFSKNDVLEGCPTVGTKSAEAALKKLCSEKYLIKIGSSRATRYYRNDAEMREDEFQEEKKEV